MCSGKHQSEKKTSIDDERLTMTVVSLLVIFKRERSDKSSLQK